MVDFSTRIAAVEGKKQSGKLSKLGMETIGDLLNHYPRRYLRKESMEAIDELGEGDWLTMFGRIVSSNPKTYQDRRTHRTAYRLEVRVEDVDRRRLSLTFFDRQKHTAEWRAAAMRVGVYGMFSGKLGRFQDNWQLTNPQHRLFGEEDAGRDALESVPELIPLYPASSSVQTWDIEEAIRVTLEVLDDYPETLPEPVRKAEDLLDARSAYSLIHRPDTWAQKVKAEQRLKYDEAFVAQTVLARSRRALAEIETRRREGRPGGLLDRFDEQLPFELTAGQVAVTDEILQELGRGHPMHRLLQGEVGSGKTIVALRAMLRVVDSGGQAALLAPTEVLAQQHHRSITGMLGELAQGGLLGGAEDGTRVALLTGSMGTAARKQAMLDAASGEAGIVIGTHALLEDNVTFFDLGLVVVDEQHRFGVEQRAALTGKAGSPPHVLVMTATPIPRTVAMTVFGDLDTSTLTELPAGRGEVQTTVVPLPEKHGWLDRAWERIAEEVAAGRQAYVVCPRIGDDPDEESELRAVEEVTLELAEGPLKGVRVQELHGRMPPEDKDAVMRAFAAGEIDVLVSTTVIEVGVDVPNATVMVILDADRFGVSQLHQLRGRIGRGGHAGLCLLVTTAKDGSSARERLAAVAASRDGFELSRVDLAQRREGNVLGREQSGRSLAGFKLLSVLDDEEVIVRARQAAVDYLETDPDLSGAPDLRDAVLDLERGDQAAFMEMS